MAKSFTPRVSKKQRKKIDLTGKLSRDLFQVSDDRLLKDARLEEVKLSTIVVKEQVRTKFNDSSLKELAENIRLNGLIQPLVAYREKKKLRLICGERRFRAMGIIDKKSAPCFILENKTQEELMAIQFSENSSREELHFIDKAEGILNYQKATKASERQIMRALGISKSEVHRSLLIAKLPKRIREAAKQYNIEKYVLIELDAIEDKKLKTKLVAKVASGEITKRAQLKKAIVAGGVVSTSRASTKKRVKKGMTASAFIKAMEIKKKKLGLDPEMAKMLDQLVEETKDMVN